MERTRISTVRYFVVALAHSADNIVDLCIVHKNISTAVGLVQISSKNFTYFLVAQERCLRERIDANALAMVVVPFMLSISTISANVMRY